MREGQEIVCIVVILRKNGASMIGSQTRRFGGRGIHGGQSGDWCR
jgi:hypothetical protein